jgi:hypothetical protein
VKPSPVRGSSLPDRPGRRRSLLRAHKPIKPSFGAVLATSVRESASAGRSFLGCWSVFGVVRARRRGWWNHAEDHGDPPGKRLQKARPMIARSRPDRRLSVLAAGGVLALFSCGADYASRGAAQKQSCLELRDQCMLAGRSELFGSRERRSSWPNEHGSEAWPSRMGCCGASIATPRRFHR